MALRPRPRSFTQLSRVEDLVHKTYGLKAFGDSIAANCALARRLGQRIERERALRLPAPVALNIVNHRTDETDIDTLPNDVLIFELQEELAAC